MLVRSAHRESWAVGVGVAGGMGVAVGSGVARAGGTTTGGAGSRPSAGTLASVSYQDTPGPNAHQKSAYGGNAHPLKPCGTRES